MNSEIYIAFYGKVQEHEQGLTKITDGDATIEVGQRMVHRGSVVNLVLHLVKSTL